VAHFQSDNVGIEMWLFRRLPGAAQPPAITNVAAAAVRPRPMHHPTSSNAVFRKIGMRRTMRHQLEGYRKLRFPCPSRLRRAFRSRGDGPKLRAKPMLHFAFPGYHPIILCKGRSATRTSPVTTKKMCRRKWLRMSRFPSVKRQTIWAGDALPTGSPCSRESYSHRIDQALPCFKR
jgi:hypothetical protein